jgi:hypothetical protein
MVGSCEHGKKKNRVPYQLSDSKLKLFKQVQEPMFTQIYGLNNSKNMILLWNQYKKEYFI